MIEVRVSFRIAGEPDCGFRAVRPDEVAFPPQFHLVVQVEIYPLDVIVFLVGIRGIELETAGIDPISLEDRLFEWG